MDRLHLSVGIQINIDPTLESLADDSQMPDRKYLNSRPVIQGVSSLPREVSDDASLQPAPRLLLSQAPQSLLSRAQEAL